MKILVTGGAGFIGSHVVRNLLQTGYTVAILDDFNDFYDPRIKRANVKEFNGEAEVIEADIRDASAMKDVVGRGAYDSIIHIAARAGVRPSVLNPSAYIETNVVGTYNLLEAARLSRIGQFLLASSSSVYGMARKVPFSEDLALPQTLSPYAATKLAAEHLCGSYSHLYQLPVVVTRFFTVYGPAQRPDLAIYKFTDCIYHGRPIQQYGDGTTRRDYTYVDDIVQGVLGALKYRRTPFEIFNLGENQTTTLSDLIGSIENALGKRAIIEHLPEQQGDMPLTCADIDKARALLGYHPRVKVSEGIPKFVEWYLKQQKR
jgi:UDP-glucuronate 4-epimerase